MARVEDVKRETLNARQQKLYDEIMRTRPRGKLSGPFSVWMHTPDLAEPANGLADCFRVNPRFDKRLIELITLMMCRAATVKYAWSVHEPLARQAGLSPQIVDAIRANKRPDFSRDDERLIYDLVTELITTKTLSDAIFERAIGALRPRRRDRGGKLRRLLRHDRLCAQRLRSAAPAGRRNADLTVQRASISTLNFSACSSTARPCRVNAMVRWPSFSVRTRPSTTASSQTEMCGQLCQASTACSRVRGRSSTQARNWIMIRLGEEDIAASIDPQYKAKRVRMQPGCSGTEPNPRNGVIWRISSRGILCPFSSAS